MTRVLLVCPEPLGHGQPAGIGIRFLEMANVLRANGHEVTLLSRDGGAVAGCAVGTITPRDLREGSERNDVAVVQGHVANEFVAHGRRIPLVIDLYDPFIIENLHYFAERGAEVFAHDHATLIRSLLQGDVFLCASEAQRLFYLGILLAVGRLNPLAFERDPHFDSLLRIAPFGVQPPRRRALRDLAEPAVLFGGIYDWYDPILAIEAVAVARRELPGMTLTFTHHPNPGLTPQGKTAEAMEHVQRRGFDFVRFEPWVAYGRRGEFFDRFALALLTFPRSIETDLSMRTRVYDYLWGGLPIVTSSAPGTDEIIMRYGAGAIVGSESVTDFAQEIVRAVRENEVMAAGTTTFALQHQWSRTLKPLLELVRDPRADLTKETFAATPRLPERRPSFFRRLQRRALAFRKATESGKWSTR